MINGNIQLIKRLAFKICLSNLMASSGLDNMSCNLLDALLPRIGQVILFCLTACTIVVGLDFVL